MSRAKVTGPIWPSGRQGCRHTTVYPRSRPLPVGGASARGTATASAGCQGVAEEGGAGTQEGGAGTGTEALFLGLGLPQRALGLMARLQGIE